MESLNQLSSSNILNESGLVSSLQETSLSVSSSSQGLSLRDTQPGATRAKRQDWCRWPVCKDYYKGGQCPYEHGGDKDEVVCQLAHIREEDGVSMTADGYIRVCFDSMGLIQVGD